MRVWSRIFLRNYDYIKTGDLMNEWIEKSVKMANSPGYLDNLFRVYPLLINPERELPKETEEMIIKLVKKKEKKKLIKILIELEKFPIDNPYVGSLRTNEELIDKNPKIVDMICEQLFSMGANGVIRGCKTPKKSSRQFGAIFQKWVPSLKHKILEGTEFEKFSGVAFLGGSDATRKNYANKKLNCNLREKGLDLLMKINGKFVIGQAKFITTGGGAQDNQFYEALRFVNSDRGKATRIAVLDGVIWFSTGYLEEIKETNRNILSALLLGEFIKSMK